MGSSWFVVVHAIAGRLRIRLTRDQDEDALGVAAAFLSQRPGVVAVRTNHGCRSLVIRFNPNVTAPHALLCALDTYLGLQGFPGESAPASRDVTVPLLRALPAIVFDLIDPPGLGLVRDILRVLVIARDAVRELRVRPWRHVMARAAVRVVSDCTSLDVLFPPFFRIALRVGRAAVRLRTRAVWECSFLDVLFPPFIRIVLRLGRATLRLRKVLDASRVAPAGSPQLVALAA